MDLIQLLIFIVIFCVVAYGAYWIITKFFPDPAKMIALAVVGVILLIILLSQFVPGVGHYQIWR